MTKETSTMNESMYIFPIEDGDFGFSRPSFGGIVAEGGNPSRPNFAESIGFNIEHPTRMSCWYLGSMD